MVVKLKKRIFFGMSLLIILFFLVIGCTPVGQIQSTSGTVYISEVSLEPNLIGANSDFTIFYKIRNPTKNDDVIYVGFEYARDCLTPSDYRVRDERFNLGTIQASSQSIFSIQFRTNQDTEGDICSININIYPTEESTTTISAKTIQIPIARPTRNV